MKTISNEKTQDIGIAFAVIIAIIFTSLAWIGDIASWAILANGFIPDILILIVAIGSTIFTIYIYRKNKADRETKLASEKTIDEEESEIDPDVEFLTELKGKIVLTCTTCGEIIPSSNEVCSACGSQKPVCYICLSPLLANEDIVKVPCCQNYAHKEHIINWINVDGSCQKCKKKLKEKDLIPIYLSPN